MINYSYFPNKWKEAKVITLPKKDKDKALPVSYRPISLLSNIGKVYEMVINDIINIYCREKITYSQKINLVSGRNTPRYTQSTN